VCQGGNKYGTLMKKSKGMQKQIECRNEIFRTHRGGIAVCQELPRLQLTALYQEEYDLISKKKGVFKSVLTLCEAKHNNHKK
jgi:hypothetical protein